jgi:stage V sporulation protein G
MEITEIRIKLMEGSEDRLRAFCSITIDQSFVVRDLKIIDGSHGPFVAMPSRKLTGHCNRCGSKNHLRAGFCNQCGAKLFISGAADSPQKLYADVAHPINSECREMIQNAVIEEFKAELQRSAQPNYRSRYDDDFDAGDYDEADYVEPAVARVDEAGTPQQAPHFETRSTEPRLTELAANAESSAEATAEDDNETILVRGEGAVQNRLPRPHFRDRPGGSGRPLVPVGPSSEGASSQRESADQTDADDDDDINPGFGAGILDG